MFRNKKSLTSKRRLGMETLENREMLSVNPLGYDSFQPDTAVYAAESQTFSTEAADTANIKTFTVTPPGKNLMVFDINIELKNNATASDVYTLYYFYDASDTNYLPNENDWTPLCDIKFTAGTKNLDQAILTPSNGTILPEESGLSIDTVNHSISFDIIQGLLSPEPSGKLHFALDVQGEYFPNLDDPLTATGKTVPAVNYDISSIPMDFTVDALNSNTSEYELRVCLNEGNSLLPNIYYTLYDGDDWLTNGADAESWTKYTGTINWQKEGNSPFYNSVITLDPKSFGADYADIALNSRSIMFLASTKTNAADIDAHDTIVFGSGIGPQYPWDTNNIDQFTAQLNNDYSKVDLTITLKKAANDLTEKSWQYYEIYYYVGDSASTNPADWINCVDVVFPHGDTDLGGAAEVNSRNGVDALIIGEDIVLDLTNLAGMNVSSNIYFRIASTENYDGNRGGLASLVDTKVTGAVAYDLSDFLMGVPPKWTDSLSTVSGITTNQATITWSKPTTYYPGQFDNTTTNPVTKIQVQTKNAAGNPTGYYVSVYNAYGTVITDRRLIGTGTSTNIYAANGNDANQQYYYVIEAVLLDSNKQPLYGGNLVAVASGTFRTLQANQIAAKIPAAPPTSVKAVFNNTAKTVTVTWKAPANFIGGYEVLLKKSGDALSMGGHFIKVTLPPDEKKLSVTVPVGSGNSSESLIENTRYRVTVRANNGFETETYVNTGANVADPLPDLRFYERITQQPSILPTASTLKPPTLDTSSLGKSQQADAITERSATVYWKDAAPPATVNSVIASKALWYKISVRDSFGVLIDTAYVASGVEQYQIPKNLVPGSTYKVSITTVFNPQKKIITALDEVVSSKELTITVKTPAFPPAKVTAATATYDSNTISIIDKTFAVNSATPNKYYYVEYTSVINSAGQPDWDSAFVEDVSSVTFKPTDSAGTVVANYRLKQSLTPGAQYYVRVVTLDVPLKLPGGFGGGMVAYSATAKFKTAALPAATIAKSGFTITDDFLFGIDFKGKSLEQAAKAKNLNLATMFPGISYIYELLVATETKVDKGTGLLNGAVSIPMAVNMGAEDFFADPVALGGESGIFKKLGINSSSLTSFKSLGFQLKITVNYNYKSTPSDPGVPTSFDVYTKPVKLAMPKWFFD